MQSELKNFSTLVENIPSEEQSKRKLKLFYSCEIPGFFCSGAAYLAAVNFILKFLNF